MNKILERLGLYDLTVVLLTGMIISTLTTIILEQAFDYPHIGELFKTDKTVLFLVISYFIGVVFQEMGSILQKLIMHKGNGVLKRVLNTSDNPHYLLSETEKTKIFDFVRHKLQLHNIQDEDAIIYNYCKSSLMKNGDMTQADRNQYISGMSRSLSIYFGLIFVFVLGKTIIKFNLSGIIVTLLSSFLCLLLYQRSVRFAIMRYVYVFRAFYYQISSETQS